MSLSQSIATAFNSVKNTTVAHSPEILMGVGAASIIGGIVLTIKNSPKANDILMERKQAIEDLKELQEENPEQYEVVTMEKDVKKVNQNTAIGLIKTYGPGIALTATGLASMIFANSILSNRYKAAVTAYTGLSGAFAAYRERAKAVFGEDADDKIMYGIETLKKQKVVTTDPETGEEKTETRDIQVAKNPWGVSQYARFFEPGETIEWDTNDLANEAYIMGIQASANDRLRYKGKNGVMVLNEVYDMLGFEPTQDGAEVGWCFDGTGDDRVIFKVLRVARPIMDPVGNETGKYHDVFLIDFNVDGPVVHKYKKHRFSVKEIPAV